jgi:hypothetical protein
MTGNSDLEKGEVNNTSEITDEKPTTALDPNLVRNGILPSN